MKRKQIVSLSLAAMMGMSIMAGCAPKKEAAPAVDPKAADAADAPATDAAADAPATDAAADAPAADATATNSEYKDPYHFEYYFSYDWWDLKPWGEDEVSKFLNQKFNVTITTSKPDADAQAKLNLMASSGDFPELIMMDRGPDNIKLAKLGIFQPLAPFIEKNPQFNELILPSTQKLLSVEDNLYAVPNWARTVPTGGNDCWIYDQKIYDKVGKPDLKTFEGLYAYAKAVKEQAATTDDGKPVVPFIVSSNPDDAEKMVYAFNRSMGGVNTASRWYGRVDGKLQLILRSPIYKAATLEANKWYREGLVSTTQFTDTREQQLEKMVAGRVGLMYYDMSQDSINHFRQILMEDHPGDTYKLVTDPVYPPANGLDSKKIYADEKPTVGWNISCITTKATDPQRIFDLLTYMLTKEGSINLMYGPKGQIWDELDANGNPILKTPESEISSDEKKRLGLWNWAVPGHSDNVDMTKFAVNAMQPEDKRDWVISNQSDVLTPGMFVTDEYVGLNEVVDQASDEGINRTLCEDQIKATLPKIIMAASADEATKLYDELVAFCDKNGIGSVEQAYDAKYQENVKIQGKTMYDR